jgi:hypothetical protein
MVLTNFYITAILSLSLTSTSLCAPAPAASAVSSTVERPLPSPDPEAGLKPPIWSDVVHPRAPEAAGPSPFGPIPRIFQRPSIPHLHFPTSFRGSAGTLSKMREPGERRGLGVKRIVSEELMGREPEPVAAGPSPFGPIPKMFQSLGIPHLHIPTSFGGSGGTTLSRMREERRELGEGEEVLMEREFGDEFEELFERDLQMMTELD